MINVLVGGRRIGKWRKMRDARQMAAFHVMELVMNRELEPDASVTVVYKTGDQIVEQTEMFGPALGGGLSILDIVRD